MGSGFTDEQIVSGMLSGEKEIIRWFYDQVFPVVRRFVLDHRGTGPDAHDLFQDALLILYKKVSQDHFVPQGSVQDYLLGTCRKLWYRKCRQFRSEAAGIPEELPEIADESPDSDDSWNEDEKYALFLRHFGRLEKICREILILFFLGTGYEKMSAKVTGYSLQYLPKKKQRCLKTLIEGICQDPDFKRLF